MKKSTIFILIFLISISFAYASVQVGDTDDSDEGVNIVIPVAPINYSIQNVSSANLWDLLDVPTDIPNSEFWYNHSLFTAGSFVPYSGAISNVGLGIYNLTTDGWFFGKFNWTSGDDYNIFDGSNLTFNTTKLEVTYYNATSVGVNIGAIEGGDIESTWEFGGESLNISEAAAEPGLDIRFNFTGVSECNQLSIRFKTEPNKEHLVSIQLWDFVNEIWHDHDFYIEVDNWDEPFIPIRDSHLHIGTGGDAGKVWIRIYMSSRGKIVHIHYFDFIQLSNRIGFVSSVENDPFSWHKNQNINASNYNATFDYQTVNNDLSVGGNATFNQRVRVGDADFLTEFSVNQTADGPSFGTGVPTTGIRVYGFDDRSGNYLNLAVDQYGAAVISSLSTTMYFAPGNSLAAFFSTSGMGLGDNKDISLGSSTSDQIRIRNSIAQTAGDTLMIGLSGLTNTGIICEMLDRGFNFAHPAQANPTPFIHSANQATDEWLSLAHNQSDGIIETGKGFLYLNGTSGVKIPNDLIVGGYVNTINNIIIKSDSYGLLLGGYPGDAHIYFNGSDLIIDSKDYTANDKVHFTDFDEYNFDNNVNIIGNITLDSNINTLQIGDDQNELVLSSNGADGIITTNNNLDLTIGNDILVSVEDIVLTASDRVTIDVGDELRLGNDLTDYLEISSRGVTKPIGYAHFYLTDNKPIKFGNINTDLIISSDGTNPAYNTTGIHTFYNSSGYGGLLADEYRVATPSVDSYSGNYLDLLTTPLNMLENGKLKRENLADVEKSIVQIKDPDNCWDEIDRYCWNETEGQETCEEELKDGIKDYYIIYREECGTKDLNTTNLGGMSFTNRLMISELLEKINELEARIEVLEGPTL